MAGKQGIKGIRLSMKDYGIDVATNEKENRLKIIDSEEFFLTRARLPTFKLPTELEEEVQNFQSSAAKSNFEFGTIICETDMLVRKGFFEKYLDFEKAMAVESTSHAFALVCVYDERELQAKGLAGAERDLLSLHSGALSS